jgi:adenylate cyclase
MGLEIERKFLVRNDDWRQQADSGTSYRQGYLVGSQQASVRVRIEGEVARLNIKSATLGIRRQEYEYPLPLDEAEEMLETLCEQPQIEKTRYKLPYQGHLWEIDVFAGANQGLIVAEVELGSEDEALSLPEWVGEEVSDDPRYYNVCLVKHPYSEWCDD